VLTFDNVSFPGTQNHPTFSGLSLKIGRRRALLISERDDIPAGFINLVIGSRRPEKGSVQLDGRPSWPIGQSLMRSTLTGRETIRFLADLYNLDEQVCTRDAIRWFGVERMGTVMNSWPTVDRLKFERLAVLWPQFDIYVVYGAGPSRDDAFEAEWLARFQQKLEGRGLLAVGPPLEPWSWICDITILLRPDEAICYSDVTDALLDVKPAAAGELLEESKRTLNDDDELF